MGNLNLKKAKKYIATSGSFEVEITAIENGKNSNNTEFFEMECTLSNGTICRQKFYNTPLGLGFLADFLKDIGFVPNNPENFSIYSTIGYKFEATFEKQTDSKSAVMVGVSPLDHIPL